MAFSPRGFLGSDASFSPLLRLLDEFDHYTRHEGGNQRLSGRSTFQPRFDIRETGDSYELHGELPGMSKENVHVEFTDRQSMLISGKLERTYTAGNPPAGQIEGSVPSAITQGDSAKDSTGTSIEKQKEGKNGAEDAKYWLTERSVGTFSRSFSFPSHVDQDAVSASFKDGILSIVVPKAKKAESRRITIS